MWRPRLPRFIARHIEALKNSKLRRKHKRDLESVYDLFERDIAKAKDYTAQRELEALRDFECSEFEEKIQRMDSLDLANRAKRCHIDVSDLGAPSEGEANHWIQGGTGVWFLNPKSFRMLAKAVEAAEHERSKRQIERSEFWWKLITALAAIGALILGIMNFVKP